MNKDEIEFITIAKLDENGNLQWNIETTHQSDVITEEFKDALWDQFTIELEEKKNDKS